MPENGYGAINLRFLLSELETSHTRSVHPISLIDTGQFVSRILGVEFRYENPYLFQTKTQMCKAVCDFSTLAFNTISCDGRHRRPDQLSQCGYCSSCLLRRIALINALGYDHTEYVATHGIIDIKQSHRAHFEAMRYQAEALNAIFQSADPWSGMLQRDAQLRKLVSRFSDSGNVSRASVANKLLHLYENHVQEWSNVEHLLRRSLFDEAHPENNTTAEES